MGAGKSTKWHMQTAKTKHVCSLSWGLQIVQIFLLCWGLSTHQPLWVILCRLSEEGKIEIEEIVEEMKERNKEETGMKVKK